MKHLIQLALLAAAGTLIAGCASTPGQCDPKKEDFFNNTGCLTSGTYKQRQRDLESELSRERSRNAMFRALLADLEAEQAQVRGQLQAKQAAYASVDAAWRDVRSSLSSEMQRNGRLRSRVNQLDQRVSGRKSVDATGDLAKKRAVRDQLKSEILQLESELDAGVY